MYVVAVVELRNVPALGPFDEFDAATPIMEAADGLLSTVDGSINVSESM